MRIYSAYTYVCVYYAVISSRLFMYYSCFRYTSVPKCFWKSVRHWKQWEMPASFPWYVRSISWCNVEVQSNVVYVLWRNQEYQNQAFNEVGVERMLHNIYIVTPRVVAWKSYVQLFLSINSTLHLFKSWVPTQCCVQFVVALVVVN